MAATPSSVQGALSCDAAHPLTIGQPVGSRFRHPAEVHYYRVPVPEQFTELKIVLTPHEGLTYTLYQRCRDGVPGGAVPHRRGVGIRVTSPLFLAVQRVEGASSGETYTLRVERGAMMA